MKQCAKMAPLSSFLVASAETQDISCGRILLLTLLRKCQLPTVRSLFSVHCVVLSISRPTRP